MFMSKLLRYIFTLLFFLNTSLVARNVLLEFKAAYFLSASSQFKDIYGKGSALYGPELTFQLACNKNWYGFVSADFFTKSGHSIGLDNKTKVFMMPLAIGLKYFVPFSYGDFYLGLGFQPTYLRTKNDSQYVIKHSAKWGFGGIVKGGVYFKLPYHLLLDIFVGYSFVKAGHHRKYGTITNTIVSRKADLSGGVFGCGLGYRF